MRVVKVRELDSGYWSVLGQRFQYRVQAENYAYRSGALRVKTILLEGAYAESWLENRRVTR